MSCIGESSYSYPSDIWSFGLALLTIAQGYFPYSKSLSSRQRDNDAREGKGEEKEAVRPRSQAQPQQSHWNDLFNDDDDDFEGAAGGDLNGGGFWTMVKAVCGEY